MKIDFSIDWGDIVAYVLFAVFYVGVVGGMGAIVWELDQMRTDTSPRRIEVEFSQQQPGIRPRFERKTVEL